MDKISLLRSVFVFGGLDENLLAKIAERLREAKFAAGEEIFAQDRRADSFFIVSSGEVTISKKIGSSHEKTLAVLGAGSVFGEMAFFSDSPRTAGASAKTDAALWKIDREDFMKFVSEEPAAGFRILSGLLQVAMDRLEHTSRELATIYHTGKIIASALKLSDILKATLEEILLAIPGADDGAAYIYNEYNEEFDPAAAPENAGEISPKSPLAVFIRQRTEGAIIPSQEGIESLKEEFLSGAVSLLASPIIKDSKMQGFILLWNNKKPNAFTGNQLLLVSTVSSQLAEAVENIRHRQDQLDRQRLNNAKESY